MKKNKYPIDYSAILYLAQMRRNHTNVYRFSLTMQETVDPTLLQKAADTVYTRFPTIFAGFRHGFFSCAMVPAEKAPLVVEDPGVLQTMSPEEIRTCAYRIFYSGNRIIIEAFHALTDGYGALVSLRTLVAEYVHLRYGVRSPEQQQMLENGEPDWTAELGDAYQDYAREKPARQPNRKAYQLPGENRDWKVKVSVEQFPTRKVLEAARNHGVSMTSLLSCIMAEAVMEVQARHVHPENRKPVRIMVPIDLRRLFPSRTLRNFILYALPTMECGDSPRKHRLASFHAQLQRQVTREALGAQISANVQVQQMRLFRMIPLQLKLAAMRLAYRFLASAIPVSP